ncbi:MAG: Txe/YoeB family addiction module toxin [Anaerovibrio sp.]
MNNKIVFSASAWQDINTWVQEDRKVFKKINVLIQDIARNGNEGIGKPEPLINMNGYWSRRITDKDRLIYKVQEDAILIAACKGHYGDK